MKKVTGGAMNRYFRTAQISGSSPLDQLIPFFERAQYGVPAWALFSTECDFKAEGNAPLLAYSHAEGSEVLADHLSFKVFRGAFASDLLFSTNDVRDSHEMRVIRDYVLGHG